MKTTLRKCLQRRGFRFDEAFTLIIHPTTQHGDPVAWGDPGDQERDGAPIIFDRFEIADGAGSFWVDTEYDDGYGTPQCPRFVAYQHGWIYFPWQYDGCTDVDRVHTDPSVYASPKAPRTPYPGG